MSKLVQLIDLLSEVAEADADEVQLAAKKKKAKKPYQGADPSGGPTETSTSCTIKKSDDELQIVWGEVYVPTIPDAHGHVMRVDEVRKMAYRTMANAFGSTGIFNGSDVQHDNVAQDCVVVESFIARKDDPTFIEDSWVVGLHIADPALWSRVKKGELNGFSIQASVHMQKTEIEVDIPDVVNGQTEHASSGDLHTHPFRVRFDEDGVFLGGEALMADGHRHDIKTGSVTETNDGHSHRYNLLDLIFNR